MTSDLPNDVVQFINRYIHSVEQLEILLYLTARAPQESKAKPLSDEIQSSTSSVEKRLLDLQRQKLVERIGKGADAAYRYAPFSPEIDTQVRRLLEIYPTWRFRVIQLIFSKPIDQIRQLADAFRLRDNDEQEKDNG